MAGVLSFPLDLSRIQHCLHQVADQNMMQSSSISRACSRPTCAAAKLSRMLMHVAFQACPNAWCTCQAGMTLALKCFCTKVSEAGIKDCRLPVLSSLSVVGRPGLPGVCGHALPGVRINPDILPICPGATQGGLEAGGIAGNGDTFYMACSA